MPAATNGTTASAVNEAAKAAEIARADKARKEAAALAAADNKAAMAAEKHAFARAAARRAAEKHDWAIAARKSKAALRLLDAVNAEGGVDKQALTGLRLEGHDLQTTGQALRNAQADVEEFLADWMSA